MKPANNNTILYIDDDGDDIEMLTDAINSIDSAYRIATAANGEEGLTRLHAMKQQGEFPCLIVLDLNMPKLNGKETFRRIKADEKLARIPLVIFSTANNPSEKTFFSQSNTEYITKPVNFSHFVEIAKKLLHYCAN